MLLIISVTAGAVIFTWFVFRTLFGYLKPEIVKDDYVPCRGGWHEEYLNQCEHDLMSVPQQPVNTYTNLAYLAAGISAGMAVGTYVSWVFVATMIYLTIGSSLYHATSTRWAGMLDVTAIYAVFSALAAYAALDLFGAEIWLMTLLMFVIAGFATYFLSSRYRRNMHMKIGIFLGLAYLLLIIDMWVSDDWSAWPFLVASFALFALAMLMWVMDRAKTFPIKRWGHGVWHILTAAASGLVFYAIHATE